MFAPISILYAAVAAYTVPYLPLAAVLSSVTVVPDTGFEIAIMVVGTFTAMVLMGRKLRIEEEKVRAAKPGDFVSRHAVERVRREEEKARQ